MARREKTKMVYDVICQLRKTMQVWIISVFQSMFILQRIGAAIVEDMSWEWCAWSIVVDVMVWKER